jgi:Family of unknown function (DUF6651)
MTWKLDESGNFIKDANGNPIFTKDGGNEEGFDPNRSLSENATLRHKSKSIRLQKEELETKLKEFGDYQPNDVNDVMKALDEAKEAKMSDKQKVEQMQKDSDVKYKTLEAKYNTLKQDNYSTALQNSIFNAPVLQNLIPGLSKEKVFRIYKDNFQKNDKGETIAYHNGNPILDTSDPSKYASVEDSLSYLIEKDPDRDSMMKPSGASGTGSKESVNISSGNGKTFTIAEMNSMSDAQLEANWDAVEASLQKQ